MRSDTYCKRLFTIGAIWNWAVAALLFSASTISNDALSLFLNRIPNSFLWFNLFMGVVVILGLGYYWVAQDVRRNRDIIKLGILAKSLVVALVVPAWFSGEVTTLTVGAATVDFVFTILFVDVLLNTPA